MKPAPLTRNLTGMHALNFEQRSAKVYDPEDTNEPAKHNKKKFVGPRKMRPICPDQIIRPAVQGEQEDCFKDIDTELMLTMGLKDDYESEIARAMVMMEPGDSEYIRGAAKIFKGLARRIPERPDAHHWLGNAYDVSGDGMRALGCFLQAMARYPEAGLDWARSAAFAAAMVRYAEPSGEDTLPEWLCSVPAQYRMATRVVAAAPALFRARVFHAFAQLVRIVHHSHLHQHLR